MTWIFLTLGAVLFQTFRNAFQSKLGAKVNTSGVTLARFLFAPPIALVYLLGLYQFYSVSVPSFSMKFIGFVCISAVMQIVATFLMVTLFKQKNFAVGAGLAKSEALVAAVLGTLFFGSQLSLLGWVGIVVGAVAVFVLSGATRKGELSIKTALIGLACGGSFALTSLYVREAAQLLDVPFPVSAAWVLLWVLCVQTALLAGYIAVKEPEVFGQLRRQLPLTLAASTTSCFGSMCWFSAMSIQYVAYVKTLGQVEVLTTMLISAWMLKTPVKRNEIAGLLLISAATICVMWT